VGEPRYPTPVGRFTVQSMQKDPTWNVPDSDWAGDMAGKTIPGGDPRNPLVARWIGYNGSVGFHGTASTGTLGSAASHGCVRMAIPDVEQLYDLVPLHTPIYVG
jgi:lipoprotein-anchoring transpeptidase ErfK/SrfK